MRIDPLWNSIFSDLFVNLSAGYFGAAFLTPSFSRKQLKAKIRALIIHIIFASLFLLLAYIFRKL